MAHLLHFVVGFALLGHVLLWGAGAAMLAMPRTWRRFWPVLAAPLGFALQSAVVWAGALAGLRGTNSYAWAGELVPLALLAVALRQHGLRATWVNVSRFGLVWAQMAGCLMLLILPLAIASKGLTTFALSSCDAGDYGGGARVLMEFARGDRTGFLGLTEVVRVASVDNFFDYWLRLNHFTPAALIAFNGSILHCPPHELTTLMTMVLLVGTVPVVFWIARAVLGYSGGPALFVALLYGLSPVTWYAAMQVAMGQLLAAPAIALLTWAGVALWRGRLNVRRAVAFGGVLAASYWLVLGSYNFIVLVCLVPAIAYAGGRAIWTRQWARFGRWLLAMLLPLAVVALVFWGRVAGLAEFFGQLRTHDFGWRIALLTPEGWLGLVSGPDLEPWRFLGLRWLLMLLLGGPLAWAWWRAFVQSRPGAWVVASLLLPALAGYFFLEARARMTGTNASYDAYKLFAVYYPLILAAACWWLTLRRSRRLTEWFGVVGLAAFVIAGNVVALGMFTWRMAQAPLIVDLPLRDVRRLEGHPEVTSVNVLLDHMWERLWANALLLRKPQYFLTTSYEARWATPLRGEWDLRGGMIHVVPPEPDAHVVVNDRYRAIRRTPHFLTAEFGEGWHAEETAAGARWRWSRPAGGELVFNNPQARPLRVTLVLDARSYGPMRIRAGLKDEASTPEAGANVTAERKPVRLPPIVIPPGRHLLKIATGETSAAPPADARGLGLCVWSAEIEVLP